MVQNKYKVKVWYRLPEYKRQSTFNTKALAVRWAKDMVQRRNAGIPVRAELVCLPDVESDLKPYRLRADVVFNHRLNNYFIRWESACCTFL